MTSRARANDFRIIITADRGGGKTTFIKRVASFLAVHGIPCSGFFAEARREEEGRERYILTMLPGMTTIPLCDRYAEGWLQYGRFRYNPAAIERGNRAVARTRPGDIIIMDEIGLQELRGYVWADALSSALIKNNPMILSVQHRNLDGIIEKWHLRNAVIFNGSTSPWDDIWNEITSNILNMTLPAV
ncbi:MAG: hypothetical protein JW807_10300 [Spirochaetes bacterium]|nr:hypothetical protein [Spirochaetota bacterium]